MKWPISRGFQQFLTSGSSAKHREARKIHLKCFWWSPHIIKKTIKWILIIYFWFRGLGGLTEWRVRFKSNKVSYKSSVSECFAGRPRFFGTFAYASAAFRFFSAPFSIFMRMSASISGSSRLFAPSSLGSRSSWLFSSCQSMYSDWYCS